MVIENEQLKFIWLQNKTALLLDIATLVKKNPESFDCRAFASYKRFLDVTQITKNCNCNAELSSKRGEQKFVQLYNSVKQYLNQCTVDYAFALKRLRINR